VCGFTANFYARWRVSGAVVPALHEGAEAAPPERLLQAIWQHQRLIRERLRTPAGGPVRVLHPGFRNPEAGPDFTGAVIQFGAEAPQSGDVEIDLRPQGWQAHGHDHNPAYRNVILHAVWEAGPTSDGTLPTLPLAGTLDAPLRELNWTLAAEVPPPLPQCFLGRCVAPLSELAADEVATLLRQAAQVRFECKAAALRARARQTGWEQALWEGLFRALGYKWNSWPMQRLAELRERWQPGSSGASDLQARLLGIGGLLPAELTRSQAGTDRYLRRIWDQWWRERDAFADSLLPRQLWRFCNLRPANHPQRRLALASHWLAAGGMPEKLARWLTADVEIPQLEHSLLEALQVGEDPFWSWHWTLRSARLPKAQPLVGARRVTDLAVNVVLPWLWSRALSGAEAFPSSAGGAQANAAGVGAEVASLGAATARAAELSSTHAHLRQRVEQRYFAWPAAEDNARLKLARERLLGGKSPKAWRGAAAQQGLLQILGDFCDHTNALCDDCHFPQLVRDWQSAQAKPSSAR
jgi:hypothetical protein